MLQVFAIGAGFGATVALLVVAACRDAERCIFNAAGDE